MVKISNVLDVTSNDKGQFCYQEKPISTWWGKTYYYYNTKNKTLNYRYLTLFGRFLHLFGYAKNYHRADAKKLEEWKGHFNLCKATSPLKEVKASSSKKNTPITPLPSIHQSTSEITKAVTPVFEENKSPFPPPPSFPPPPLPMPIKEKQKPFLPAPHVPPPSLPDSPIIVESVLSLEQVKFFVVLSQMLKDVPNSPRFILPWGEQGCITKDQFNLSVSDPFTFCRLMQIPAVYDNLIKLFDNRKTLLVACEVTTDLVHRLCWVLLCHKSIDVSIKTALLNEVFNNENVKKHLSSLETPVLKTLYEEALLDDDKLAVFLEKKENIEALIAALNTPSEKQAIAESIQDVLNDFLIGALMLNELQSNFLAIVAFYAKKEKIINYFTRQNDADLLENFNTLSSTNASSQKIENAFSKVVEHLMKSKEAMELFIEQVDPVHHFKAALYLRNVAWGIDLFSEICKTIFDEKNLSAAIDVYSNRASEGFKECWSEFKRVVASGDDQEIDDFFKNSSNLDYVLDLFVDKDVYQAFNTAVKPLVNEVFQKMINKL